MTRIHENDPQRTWDEYHAKKKAQRIEEAKLLWQSMAESGVQDDTILALDFVHFSDKESGARGLSDQLKENYEMTVERDGDYWLVRGTTRPYGMNLTQSQHLSWVEFMADVARSHSCVFSSWALEAPSLRRKFESKEYETS